MLIALVLAASQTQAGLDHATSAEWSRADAAMNRQYRATMARMKVADAHPQPGATIGLSYAAALLASQRACLTFRDAECLSEGYRYRSGSMEPMEALACKASLTRVRTKQLRDLMVTQ